MTVEQPGLLHHEVDGNDERYRWRKPGRQDPKGEVTFDGKTKPHEAVCRHRSEHNCEDSADRADHDTIDEIRDGATTAEDEQGVVKALESGFENPDRRPRENGGFRLECRRQNDIERE